MTAHNSKPQGYAPAATPPRYAHVATCVLCNGPVVRVRTDTGWIRGGTGRKDRMGYRLSYHCEDCGIAYGKPPPTEEELDKIINSRKTPAEVVDEHIGTMAQEIAQTVDKEFQEKVETTLAFKSLDKQGECSCLSGCKAWECDKI